MTRPEQYEPLSSRRHYQPSVWLVAAALAVVEIAFVLALAATAFSATVRCPNDRTPTNGSCSGTPGPDLIYGTNGSNYILGGGGGDEIYGRGGSDLILGGAGADALIGGYGKDDLRGEGGGDYLEGGRQVDYLFGGKGNDELWTEGDGFRDYLHGDSPWLWTGGSDACYFDRVDVDHGCENRFTARAQ